MEYLWYNKRALQDEELPERIVIFDTTLRDGEQTPGVALTPEQKIEIAKALDALGVDIIEAGFPIASKGDFKAVKEIASLGLNAEICGLARCVKEDIDKCIEANVDLIHIFIGTSPIHRKYKLRMSKEEILRKAEESIQYCLDHGFKVHFSPEDACRTEFDFLLEVCKLAEDMKVSYINIPDTVGVMIPKAMYTLIKDLRKNLKVTLAVHCHNDFGLAVANTLAAIAAGASVPHVTINSLGERAGNASLEQVVLGAKILYGIESNINTEKIYQTSKLVERLTGIRLMPNYPIVGENAFAHESGIHVHGVLAKAETYEPITPELVGAKRRVVLGKHIGIHGIEAKLKEFGIHLSKDQLREVTKRVKELGDKGKRVTEEDLLAIAEDILGTAPKEKRIIQLIDLTLYSELGRKPTAAVVLNVKGEEKYAKSQGVGPVDAALNAIRKALGENIQLEEYHLDAITGGSDALAEVTVKVSDSQKSVLARGVHEDIVMASVTAFINGVNRLFSIRKNEIRKC